MAVLHGLLVHCALQSPERLHTQGGHFRSIMAISDMNLAGFHE